MLLSTISKQRRNSALYDDQEFYFDQKIRSTFLIKSETLKFVGRKKEANVFSVNHICTVGWNLIMKYAKILVVFWIYNK